MNPVQVASRQQQIEALERKLSQVKKMGPSATFAIGRYRLEQRLQNLQAVLYDPRNARQRARVRKRNPYARVPVSPAPVVIDRTPWPAPGSIMQD